jgi:thymidylate kinase
MMMKVLVILLAAASFGVSYYSLYYGLAFAIAFSAVFCVYGIVKSVAKGIDPLNDLPNALRVLLAMLGGNVMLRGATFVFPSIGITLVLLAVLLNDEFQRLAFNSLASGKRGGTVVFLGIDGSGKSTHAQATKKWFETRGYRCKLVPFHKYILFDRLPRQRRAPTWEVGPARGNPIRPLVSLFDNLLMLVLTSFGTGLEGTVVIYDRFIWSTYVKYQGLGYPVKPLSILYLMPRPTTALLFDIPVERSLGVIEERRDHIRYSRDVLGSESDLYHLIALKRGYPVIDSSADFETVQSIVESKLSRVFPVPKGAGS